MHEFMQHAIDVLLLLLLQVISWTKDPLAFTRMRRMKWLMWLGGAFSTNSSITSWKRKCCRWLLPSPRRRRLPWASHIARPKFHVVCDNSISAFVFSFTGICEVWVCKRSISWIYINWCFQTIHCFFAWNYCLTKTACVSCSGNVSFFCS